MNTGSLWLHHGSTDEVCFCSVFFLTLLWWENDMLTAKARFWLLNSDLDLKGSILSLLSSSVSNHSPHPIHPHDHEGKQLTLILCCVAELILGRLGVLNEFSIYNIFNLPWVYWSITIRWGEILYLFPLPGNTFVIYHEVLMIL